MVTLLHVPVLVTNHGIRSCPNTMNNDFKTYIKVDNQNDTVVWDSKNKLAYAVNRASDSIVAIKLDGKLVANLKSGSYPNHLSTDGKGTVYVINKSRGKDDPTGDRVSRISLK